jgi:hypothetical protein
MFERKLFYIGYIIGRSINNDALFETTMLTNIIVIRT